MLLSDGQILDSIKFNELIFDQYTNYQQGLPLRFIGRLPEVNADDDEITAYYTGRVHAASVIADDQAAKVYEAGNLELVTNVIPNIKLGKRFSQSMISRLNRLRANQAGNGTTGDMRMWLNWETQAAADLIRGVQERKNALAMGMMIDNLSYDSLGVKITGSFGMPSNLKFTPATQWAGNPTTATPVTDILTATLFAAQNYGETYNRLTISTTDFLNMVATTEFKNLIQGIINQPLAATAFNPRDPKMRTFAASVLNMEIELEDKLIFDQNSAGTYNSGRVLPTGTLLLSNTSDDNNPGAMDFGNAIVTESVVAGLTGEGEGGLGGPQFGPIGYFTAGSDMNPPNLTAWGVARGFPRKHRKTCTAIFTGL